MILKQVLFISSSKELQNFANIFLNNGYHNLELKMANSLSEAVNYLSSSDQYELIFLGHHIIQDQELTELAKALLPFTENPNVILCGTNKAIKSIPGAHYFHPFTPKNGIFVNLYYQLKLAPSYEKYIPMPLLAVNNFEFYPFDCYIKLQKSTGNEYVKVYKIGDEVFFDDVYKYQEKGVNQFFVDSKQILKSIQALSSQLDEDSLDEINTSNVEQVHEDSLEYVSDLLAQSGIEVSEENKQLTQRSFKLAKKIVKNSLDKNEFIEDLFNKDDLFYYKHITLTSVIGCYILDELYLNDERLKEKLCLAASLHNIFLEGTDQLKVDDPDQLDRFSKKDQKKLLEHPAMAAQFFISNEKVDSDVLKIIREHHGDKMGKSFPERIFSTLKLSIIFQMSTYFAQQYLVEVEFRNNYKVDCMKIFTKIYKRIETVDKSLLKALKEVISTFNN